MSKQSRVVRQISARAEVKARVLKASSETAACRRETIAAMKAISGAHAERRARAGWLRARCDRCGGCALAS